MLDLIKILFLGTPYDNSIVTHVEKSKKRDVVFNNNDAANVATPSVPKQKYLRGFHNHAGSHGITEIYKEIKQLDWSSTAAVFVVTDNFRDANLLAQKISASTKKNIDIYGLDPDYFTTLVPILSKYRRKIENYLLNLKSGPSFREKVKYFIKKLMIITNISKSLYENFVVTIAPDALLDDHRP